jgi:GT2 family glycosyltransferase
VPVGRCTSTCVESTAVSTSACRGIDVAVPCYNYGHFLRNCVESVIEQSVTALRVLIIDNASTDDSLEIAQQLAAEHPAIEVATHPRNLGPHASFNEAIDWAEQPYFLLLCADDLVAPGALPRAINTLDRHPDAVMSYGRAALLGPGELMPPSETRPIHWRIISGDALLRRFCSSAVCHVAGCTAVVRTEAQKRVGYYRASLPHTDDFEMWMRFACHGAAAETAAIQGGLRAHSSSQSAFVRQQHRWDIMHCEEAFTSFFQREGAARADAARLLLLARRSVGERAYWSAAAHLCRGDVAEFMALIKFALRRRPSCAMVPPLSYLVRREDAWGRALCTLSHFAGGRRSKPLRPEGMAV